jgi:hypothetical protein
VTIDNDLYHVPLLVIPDRRINYTNHQLLYSSYACITIPQDPGCTSDKLGLRGTFPRVTCRFNNLYFQRDRFFYLTNDTQTDYENPPFEITTWGDMSWRENVKPFPLQMVTKEHLQTPRYEITHPGTMSTPTLAHFGHEMVEAVLPAAILLAIHFPLQTTTPYDIIITHRSLSYWEITKPLTLDGHGYFMSSSSSSNPGYRNRENDPYCSDNPDDVCLINSFAAGMGGLCEYYQSSVSPFFEAGHRLFSARTQLLLKTPSLSFQTMTPRLLIINRGGPGESRYIANVPQLITALSIAISMINITVAVMHQLTLEEQMRLYQTSSIVFGICGSALQHGATNFGQLGTGIIIGAREDGDFCNSFHMFPAFEKLFNFHYLHTITQGWDQENNITIPIEPMVQAVQAIVAKHKSNNPYPEPPYPTWHLDNWKDGLYSVRPIGNRITNVTHVNYNKGEERGHGWSGHGIGNLPPFDNPNRCSFQ